MHSRAGEIAWLIKPCNHEAPSSVPQSSIKVHMQGAGVKRGGSLGLPGQQPGLVRELRPSERPCFK